MQKTAFILRGPFFNYFFKNNRKFLAANVPNMVFHQIQHTFLT
jgi:hypothetical protein